MSGLKQQPHNFKLKDGTIITGILSDFFHSLNNDSKLYFVKIEHMKDFRKALVSKDKNKMISLSNALTWENLSDIIPLKK